VLAQAPIAVVNPVKFYNEIIFGIPVNANSPFIYVAVLGIKSLEIGNLNSVQPENI